MAKQVAIIARITKVLGLSPCGGNPAKGYEIEHIVPRPGEWVPAVSREVAEKEFLEMTKEMK